MTEMRESVCSGFGFMGMEIDTALNAKSHGVEVLISTPGSKVKVVVIPTDEEYMIASDTLDIIQK